MTIRDRVRAWLGYREDYSIADVDALVAVMRNDMRTMQAEIDELKKGPVVTSGPPPYSPPRLQFLDWEGVQFQAMVALDKDPEKHN